MLPEILAEILQYSSDYLADIRHRIMLNTYNAGCAPQDRRDANMILLYKGKCMRRLCGHYHAIVLLSPAVKVLMGILLSRLNPHIVDTVLTESESGFRPNKPMILF